VLLLPLLIPLMDGRVSGWPAWGWALLGLVVPVAGVLAWWEIRPDRRHGKRSSGSG
jgi:hypothetical protein